MWDESERRKKCLRCPSVRQPSLAHEGNRAKELSVGHNLLLKHKATGNHDGAMPEVHYFLSTVKKDSLTEVHEETHNLNGPSRLIWPLTSFLSAMESHPFWNRW